MIIPAPMRMPSPTTNYYHFSPWPHGSFQFPFELGGAEAFLRWTRLILDAEFSNRSDSGRTGTTATGFSNSKNLCPADAGDPRLR